MVFIALSITYFAKAQNVGIGTNNPSPSAILELSANNRGLLLPRMSSAERNAIASPATGLMVYDTDANTLFLFNGIRWVTIDQTNTINTASKINASYSFSSPQFIQGFASPANSRSAIAYQSVSISENLIVGITLIENGDPGYISFSINRNGRYSTNRYQISQQTNFLYCFASDSLEQNIYAVINGALFRLNITNIMDVIKIADSVGLATQIKVLANNDVIISTDVNNGSLVRVLANGTKQVIAANLKFPNYFDIFNNNYYVTNPSAITGTVKKITPAGAVSNVTTDIIAPQSIVFDKNGNFVLQTNVTVGPSIFMKFDLYNAAGVLLGPVNDDNDNAILTTYTLNAPLYVDSFNNLVFIHNGAASATVNGTANYISNPAGPYGIWILNMNKR